MIDLEEVRELCIKWQSCDPSDEAHYARLVVLKVPDLIQELEETKFHTANIEKKHKNVMKKLRKLCSQITNLSHAMTSQISDVRFTAFSPEDDV